ncbi:hypothetical protein ACCAA_430007 [Candidatus Accumulibacter aalborgensis]|uniref:Uncharacterized protein n=1 Tax=Candidatus Accumulibacter aalborgensis TaxID=1860102 RepID=A0A1A8XSB0_9PROT|nr:hypothetical protein ACCAA_430007 [Candidatus Accumulibacter aalborgensis]
MRCHSYLSVFLLKLPILPAWNLRDSGLVSVRSRLLCIRSDAVTVFIGQLLLPSFKSRSEKPREIIRARWRRRQATVAKQA